MTEQDHTTDTDGLVERLRRTERRLHSYTTNRSAPPINRHYDAFVNPDGPEAAGRIQSDATTIAELRIFLGDLLAIIHGDGGQYQDTHGTRKAVEDAIQLSAERKVNLAELRKRVRALTERYRGTETGLTTTTLGAKL